MRQNKVERDWTIERRYSHFKQLETDLKNNKMTNLPPLPPKHLPFINNSEDVLLERQVALESWLGDVVDIFNNGVNFEFRGALNIFRKFLNVDQDPSLIEDEKGSDNLEIFKLIFDKNEVVEEKSIQEIAQEMFVRTDFMKQKLINFNKGKDERGLFFQEDNNPLLEAKDKEILTDYLSVKTMHSLHSLVVVSKGDYIPLVTETDLCNFSALAEKEKVKDNCFQSPSPSKKSLVNNIKLKEINNSPMNVMDFLISDAVAKAFPSPNNNVKAGNNIFNNNNKFSPLKENMLKENKPPLPSPVRLSF